MKCSDALMYLYEKGKTEDNCISRTLAASREEMIN